MKKTLPLLLLGAALGAALGTARAAPEVRDWADAKAAIGELPSGQALGRGQDARVRLVREGSAVQLTATFRALSGGLGYPVKLTASGAGVYAEGSRVPGVLEVPGGSFPTTVWISSDCDSVGCHQELFAEASNRTGEVVDVAIQGR